MLPTPVAVSRGVRLTVVDILPLSTTVTADANGNAVAGFEVVESSYLWLVQGMSVRSTSAAATRVMVWAGPRLMDGSDSGNFDFSDRAAPILVAAGEQLQVQWTGATPGASCTIDGQYQLAVKGA